MYAYENIEMSLNYIEQHLSEKIETEKLAEIACLSTFYYQRLFKRLVKRSVQEYIKLRRLAMVIAELNNSEERILDIALKYGFSDHANFTRAFKEVYHITPDEYRKNVPMLNTFDKVIWQCVTATKKGKKFCKHSKGIPETAIEEAFVESYRLLCDDNKDVLEEFLKRTEKALGENSIEDQLHKLKKSIDKVSLKRKKLLDNYLKGIIEQDIYEETDVELKTELTNARAKLEYLQQQSDEKSSLQRRLSDFKKALSHNEVLEEFDRGIFESIVEKVIVGGLDEDGNKDPYKITFIYKTGFKNEIGNAKERFGKSSGIGDKVKKMCSDISDEVKGVCSDVSLNTCGDGSTAFPQKARRTYQRKS